MEPLETYLTARGWKNDLQQTAKDLGKFAALLTIGAGIAFAQPTPAYAAQTQQGRSKYQRTETQEKIHDLGELVIEGKIEKPRVFYILGRAGVKYEGLRLEKSFVSRIMESTRTNSF